MQHNSSGTRPRPPASTDPLRPQNPLVSRWWLAGGVGFVVLGAALLGYASFLLLFWQGQWQLLFHPSNRITATPETHSLPYQDLRFDSTETGQLQLNGWWVPAAAGARFSQLTVLFIHGASGSLSDALPEIQALHAGGVNVFSFDPRAYGRSLWATPSEEHWNEDADAAFRYLTGTRHLDPHAIVVAGTGLGASVAAELAQHNAPVPAMILIDPQPPGETLLRADPRSRPVPVHLLARDRFDPGPALAASSARKLFIATPGSQEPVPYAAHAAPPKQIVRVDSSADALAAPAAMAALQGLFASVTGVP